jgi:hypothetical protein
MGMFDTVWINCPRCGEQYEAQSKGGGCTLKDYNIWDAPQDVLSGVNDTYPFVCSKCHSSFRVILHPTIELVNE